MRSFLLFVALALTLMSSSSADAQYRRGRPVAPGARTPVATPQIGQRGPMSGRISRRPGKRWDGRNPWHGHHRRHRHWDRWRHPWYDWYWRNPYPWRGPNSYPMPYGGYGRPNYQTSDLGDQPFPEESYAPELVPDVYNADAFADGLVGWDFYTPYYDTYPVEFAYTPADAPQRAPVVHPDPDRPSVYSIIVPRPERKALYELVSSNVPELPSAG